ncbi:MAG TPA: CGNR zinc finger domain-containing protein [Nocardioides sp.]|nr:CGNR zinc finger domain-containing protein [Nocardioides sp.]
MFLNTANNYYETDVIQEPHGRADWFARHLPEFDVEGLDTVGWKRLAVLRDALRSLVAGDVSAGERVSAIAGRYPMELRFEGTGDATTSTVSAKRQGAEHAIAVAVLSALHAAATDGRLSRLRLCDRSDCRWCYYDASKNRSARWCSSDPCGDLMKARAYRSRQRLA